MDGWTKLQSSFSGLNLGQSANKFAKGFNSSVQATKERLGQVSPDEITELPQGTSTPYICCHHLLLVGLLQNTRISRLASMLFVKRI